MRGKNLKIKNLKKSFLKLASRLHRLGVKNFVIFN